MKRVLKIILRSKGVSVLIVINSPINHVHSHKTCSEGEMSTSLLNAAVSE
jgi:hypothetical protein